MLLCGGLPSVHRVSHKLAVHERRLEDGLLEAPPVMGQPQHQCRRAGRPLLLQERGLCNTPLKLLESNQLLIAMVYVYDVTRRSRCRIEAHER